MTNLNPDTGSTPAASWRGLAGTARPELRGALERELFDAGLLAESTAPERRAALIDEQLAACLAAADDPADGAAERLVERLGLRDLGYAAAAELLACYRRYLSAVALDALEAGQPGARAALERVLALLAAAGQSQAQAEIQRLRRFEMLADNAVDGVIISGLDGRVRYVNSAMARLVGFDTPAAMLAQQAKFDESDPARREFLDNILPVLLDRGYLRWDAEPVSQAGRQSFTENIGFLLRDADGKPVATAGFVRDVSAERLAQIERDQLREEMIEVQQRTLRQLSTPLIPISDTIVVMPLIGNIDAARAQQMIETLLTGVVAQQADTAILDITGVPLVDTQVADALLRAARSVGLVGARVILTGVRPEVAQTLVGLGADLGGIVSQSSLQAGIAHALRAQARPARA